MRFFKKTYFSPRKKKGVRQVVTSRFIRRCGYSCDGTKALVLYYDLVVRSKNNVAICVGPERELPRCSSRPVLNGNMNFIFRTNYWSGRGMWKELLILSAFPVIIGTLE